MLRHHVVLLPVLLILSTGTPWPAQPTWADENSSMTDPYELLGRLRTLHLLSAGLVEQASTGRAPANDFQLQARIYREQLRQTMLVNDKLVPSQQLPADLLMGMVRMSALLHAAADCKSGLVIICPPDLLRQLRAQQARVGDSLKTITPPGDGAS